MSVLLLLVAGVLGTRGATGQASAGSSAKLRSGTTQAKREPRTPAQSGPLVCPPKDLPVVEPLQHRPGHHTVILSWNASSPSPNTDSRAIRYCLFRLKEKEQEVKEAEKKALELNSACAACERINSIPFTGTRCVDDRVEDGAIYYYVVKAVIDKREPSRSSNAASATIPVEKQTIPVPPDSSPPPLCRGTSDPQ